MSKAEFIYKTETEIYDTIKNQLQIKTGKKNVS